MRAFQPPHLSIPTDNAAQSPAQVDGLKRRLDDMQKQIDGLALKS